MGGVCFLVGALIMVWNLIMTVRSGVPISAREAAAVAAA